MHADLSRDTFDRASHFASVIFQQGRVPLDADLNEQSAILLHYLRCLAQDLIGDHGGPVERLGFGVSINGTRDEITLSGPGRYYAQGVLLEIEEPYVIRLSERATGGKPLQPPFLVWLEAWERQVTAAQEGRLRESALGGPDTAARAQVTWRINTEPLQPGVAADCTRAWDVLGERYRRLEERGTLQVMAGFPRTDTHDPCILPPDSRFRGLENQLYRVEVHTGGRLAAGEQAPTFKWSRENGSVALALRSLRGDAAEVETFGLDPRLDVAPGDWVEVTDDDLAMPGRETVLAQVADVDRDEMAVLLGADPDMDLPEYEPDDPRHPLLRRWDQTDPVTYESTSGGKRTEPLVDGAVRVHPGWIELEDGIRVRFGDDAWFEPGDYWLIPARVATGDVEWPRDEAGDPAAVPARRRLWVASPLGIVQPDGTIRDCRRCITPISKPCTANERA